MTGYDLPPDGTMVPFDEEDARRASIQLSLAFEHMAERDEWPEGTRVDVYILTPARETGFGLPIEPAQYAFRLLQSVPGEGVVALGFCRFPPGEEAQDATRLRKLIDDAYERQEFTHAAMCSLWPNVEFTRVYAWLVYTCPREPA